MSTAEPLKLKVLPPLVAGQRLDQPTFHERYEAMPPGTRAELIGGVVHMPSPVGRDHANRNDTAIFGLKYHEKFTPGVRANSNLTTFLDLRAEAQPDVVLRVLPECGGQTRDSGSFVAGAPEFVIEIAMSTASTDLGRKLRDYERTGVREYGVALANPNAMAWHVWRDGRLVRLPAAADSVYRSEVFPGLWINSSALIAGNLNDLVDDLDRGLATPEHAAFVARLAAARR